MSNKCIDKEWKIQYKLSFKQAYEKYSLLTESDKPLFAKESGFIKRLSHRAIYERYLSVLDAFQREYLRLETKYPEEKNNRKLLLLKKSYHLSKLLVNSREPKRHHHFYQSENNFYYYLLAQHKWLGEELSKYQSTEPIKLESIHCCFS